jgi:PiT family inorganic phosphate transporter
MGLIMLILIGAVPTAYALNRTMPDAGTPGFVQTLQPAHDALARHADGAAPTPEEARRIVTDAIRVRSVQGPQTFAGIAGLAQDIATQVRANGAIRHVPAAAVQNVRNAMYLASEAVRLMQQAGVAQQAGFTAEQQQALGAFRGALDGGTKFIPTWVKVSVALALGLGTMIGWKRIVITVGEKIGKTHLTYAQGASAELVAAATIFAADNFGLPVSTTHVLSSGVAGKMAANGSGLQVATIRNMVMAWVLTLPAAIALSGVLYVIFSRLF